MNEINERFHLSRFVHGTKNQWLGETVETGHRPERREHSYARELCDLIILHRSFGRMWPHYRFEEPQCDGAQQS
jgi:hypothetical protein